MAKSKSKPATPTKSVLLGGTPFVKGKAYLIRTVTMTLTGRAVSAAGGFLVLQDAAWIADTGRFHQILAGGFTSVRGVEIEPAPKGDDVIVGLGAIVDAYPWAHELPRQTMPSA
jgi:hypothetical protein